MTASKKKSLAHTRDSYKYSHGDHWVIGEAPEQYQSHLHQKLNGTLPTDPEVSCDRAIRYSGLGIRSGGPVGDFLDHQNTHF